MTGLNDKYREGSEAVKIWGIDVSEVGKDAAANIQSAFADFLFDPFETGLDGMAKSFIDTVRKMIAEAQAAQLAKALFGENSKGGFLGDLFGSIGTGLALDAARKFG